MKFGNNILFLLVLLWVAGLIVGISQFVQFMFNDNDMPEKIGVAYKGGGPSFSSPQSSATDLAVPTALPSMKTSGTGRVRTGRVAPSGSSFIGGLRLGSTMRSTGSMGKMTAGGKRGNISRTFRPNSRSGLGGMGNGSGLGLGLGSTSFFSTSGIHLSSAATLHSIGGGSAGGVNSSYRSSRSSYSSSPVNVGVSIGQLSVPSLAFNRSVNNLSAIQSNSSYSAARRNGNLGVSSSDYGNYSSTIFGRQRQNDDERLAAFSNNPNGRRRDLGIYDEELFTMWSNQFVAEVGRTPYSNDELQRFIDWRLGNSMFFNPDPEPTPPPGTGIEDLYTSWYNLFVSEIGRPPHDDDELQRFIDWKLGTSPFFNPDPEPDPDPGTGIDDLYTMWYNLFVSEVGRDPIDDDELQRFIDWKLGMGYFYINENAPVGDGIWLLLLLAMAFAGVKLVKKHEPQREP